jgi:hypothetical protein
MCHDIVVAASRSHGPLAEHSIEPAGRLYERDPQGGHAARAQARTGSSSGCALLQQHLGAARQEPLQVPAGQARPHQAGHDGARPRRSIHQQHRARALQALERGHGAPVMPSAGPSWRADWLQSPRCAASMGLESVSRVLGARLQMNAHGAGIRRYCTSTRAQKAQKLS